MRNEGPSDVMGSPAEPTTAEEVVRLFRASNEMKDLVTSLYWDENVEQAAERFYRSAEYGEVRRLLVRYLPRGPWRVLDVGAGVGVSSYAFARDGHTVTAVEPDPSDVLGRGAFERLRRGSGVEMRCVDAFGEGLPVPSGAFDVVYTRQVLHHARDLPGMAREFARVLRSGGVVLATREHVVSRPEDLSAFLAVHATHRYLGNEHAYLLEQYTSAFNTAGFQTVRILGPRHCVINRFPISELEFAQDCARRLRRLVGSRLADALSRRGLVRSVIARYLDRHDHTPGRMFSFMFRLAPRAS